MVLSYDGYENDFLAIERGRPVLGREKRMATMTVNDFFFSYTVLPDACRKRDVSSSLMVHLFIV